MSDNDNILYLLKTFSSYILTTKTNALIKKENGALVCNKCGDECTAYNSVLCKGKLPTTVGQAKAWAEELFLNTAEFKPTCFECAGIKHSYKKSECCLYWIHSSLDDDVHNDGYVGITNDIKNRVCSHLGNMQHYKVSNRKLFNILSGECFIDILQWGSRDECLLSEYKYRPTERIGANLGAGGFCTRKDHGFSHHSTYKELRRFIKKCKANGVKIDLPLETEDDIRIAISIVSDISGEGGLCITDNQCPLSLTNICRRTKSEQADLRSSLLLQGNHYSLATISEQYGIKPNTICYRLRRGWSLEESLEIVKRKPKRVLSIVGQDISYTGKLSQEQANFAVSEFEKGKTLNAIGVDLGVTPKILYCLFKKAGLC